MRLFVEVGRSRAMRRFARDGRHPIDVQDVGTAVDGEGCVEVDMEDRSK